jgi:hypothetical protein
VEIGRAIPFLGLFVLNLQHWFFAVHLIRLLSSIQLYCLLSCLTCYCQAYVAHYPAFFAHFPYSPAQNRAAWSLPCLICFMDRLVYAVLTHLLNAQPLARCPALSSLWTGSSMLSWLTCSMHSHLSCLIFFMDRLFYAVLTHLLNAQPLAGCPALSSLWTGSPMLSWLTCSLHSHLLAVLTYLIYGQALLCCPNSPAQCTAACWLPCLIFFMDRLFYAVLTHLLNGQPLARCPALSSSWTGSSMLSWLILLNAQPLSCLIFFMDRLFYAVLTHLLTCTAAVQYLLHTVQSSPARCPFSLYACCSDSPAAILPLLLAVQTLLLLSCLFSLLSRLLTCLYSLSCFLFFLPLFFLFRLFC